MRIIKIVMADDHPIVRQGIQALLKSEPDFSIIGEAANGLETVKLVERLQPDVLLLDLMIPELNGFEVAKRVSRRCPKTRIVVFTIYNQEFYVLKAIKSGAAAYVVKGSNISHLIQAIRKVIAGEYYLSPPFSELDIEAYLQKAQKAKSAPVNMYETLTDREREVLELVAEGHTSVQIAAKLFISRRTVETHRANILHKLNLKTQADLIRYAIEHTILPPPNLVKKP